MKSCYSFALCTLIFVYTALTGETQQRQTKPKIEIVETDSETLWTGRYANCDYGYYVVLPKGFVAHSELPPFPNHGFLVGLPDTSTTKEVSYEKRRYLLVLANYNSTLQKSLGDVADYIIDLDGRDAPGFRVTARGPTKLDGRPAIEFKAEYDSPNGRTTIEKIVAFRWGIIYEVGIQTTAADYESDKERFESLKAGFRFWKIHYC